ncbi:MAG TPA: hypothetical protein VJ302_00660 [Blastocatellia bacterium]|nr:hypothetical protein [Blastocatellia bacterium]
MEDHLIYLIEQGQAWIRAQRELYRPQGTELSPRMKRIFASYFSAALLESVKVLQVPQIENPDFYVELEQRGQTIPLNFTETQGITIYDTVLITQPESEAGVFDSLYFHECVHVAQYRLLGIDAFIEQYVYGWAKNGCDYFTIPLERMAFEAEDLFQKPPRQPFSVEALVKAQLGAHLGRNRP